MSKLEYQVVKCGQCGAALPVRPDQESVTCKFCHSEYDVVKVHGQRINGQFGFTEGLLIGGISGLILGGILFTGVGREMAKATLKRGARLAGVAEERVEEMIRKGEGS